MCCCKAAILCEGAIPTYPGVLRSKLIGSLKDFSLGIGMENDEIDLYGVHSSDVTHRQQGR